MLLKFVKTSNAAGAGSSSSNSTTLNARGTGMRMTMSTASTMSSRIHRKGFRIPNKRHPGKAIPSKLHSINRPISGKLVPGKRLPQRPHPPHCDNSNDSGLGFDQHVDQSAAALANSGNNNNNNTHISNLNLNLNHTSGSSTSSAASCSSNSSSSSTNSSTSTNLPTNALQLQQQQQRHDLQAQQPQQAHPHHLQQQSHHHSHFQHSHHSKHQAHHQHHHQQLQQQASTSAAGTSLHHSPQQHHHHQHLIRAIPASRSTPAKKLPFYDHDETTHDDDDDFLSTDDSDANTSNSMYTYAAAQYNGGQRGQKAIKRKILETHVDLDNDDACSEDAFMHKIANENIEQQQAQLANLNMMQANILQQQQQQQMASLSTPVIAPATSTQALPPATKFISAGKRGLVRVANKRQPAVPQNSIAASQNGQVQLEIMLQPEQQHRARYQTEGSRGAVKDRSGNGFPIVRLTGYNKPATLQVFIGTDVGRVAPHMFYQACKVAGKNSTQCNERKVDGTMVIEIDFKPETEMTVTCDCVGILKERNVDVEHRFPDHLAQKNKKKSTRCRMVFRTEIIHDDGTTETLQVCSNPIICTQPPGVPEICKKSLNSCPVDGGLELFIIGKNFLKDTQVIFQETYDHPNNDNSNTAAVTSTAATAQDLQMQPLATVDTATPAAAATATLWEQTVLPDKEYLQQTHLICTVPPYIHQNIMKPITVQVSIISSGKKSESHSFVYTPKGSYTKLAAATSLSIPFNGSGSLSATQDASCLMDGSSLVVAAAQQDQQQQQQSLWGTSNGVVAETKHEIDSGMMPPPITTQIPMGVRRPSLNTATPMITDQQLAHLSAVAAVEVLKTELLDENSQSSLAEAAVAAAAAVNMHSPESLNVCSPHSPTAMHYRSRYARKQSLDAMMFEQSNSLPGYPVSAVPNTSTNMEVAAVQAAMEMVVKSELAQELMQAHHHHQQQQQHQDQAAVTAVDKFITDIAKSTAVVSNVVAPVPDASSLFGVNAASQSVAAIDHALNDILQQQDSVLGGEPLQRSLSISSNSSASNGSNMNSPLSNSGSSPSGSSSSSLSSHNSPHAQDIILNSEPAATLSALPLQQLNVTGELTVATTSTTASAAATANSLSTDIIMNAAVSPSTILCSANGAARAVVPNIMAPHQVTMANSILNDIAMQPQPTQQDAAVAALALSNIIMSPSSANGDVLPAAPTGAVQPEVTTATSTAVSNMIIKAAADFISNQEHQAQHHHHSHHHSQQQQQQLQQQLMPHSHQQLQHFTTDHQQAQQAQATAQQQQAQVQQQQQQLLPTSPSGVAAAATDPLVNLLLNHAPVVNTQASVATDVVVPAQYPLGIAPTTPSESLIVALATENSLQKSVAAVAAVTTNGAVTTASAAADILPNSAVAVGVVPAVGANGVVALPPPIPQELTTMSDQDLISYINPSTFDQL